MHICHFHKYSIFDLEEVLVEQEAEIRLHFLFLSKQRTRIGSGNQITTHRDSPGCFFTFQQLTCHILAFLASSFSSAPPGSEIRADVLSFSHISGRIRISCIVVTSVFSPENSNLVSRELRKPCFSPSLHRQPLPPIASFSS